uniref:Exocyst complex component Sec8 n=1 Tax=Spongospora subterranea TaxID=70186 RepID=A0A0H5R8Z3_9EUKA|eukprot:CRZ10598.1 hypothetical protein [Spongospora subterranea]
MSTRSYTGTEDKDEKEVLANLTRSKIPGDVFDADTFSPFKYLDWDPKELNNWLGVVEDAVDVLVNKYHKGFNTSTNSFTAILGSFTTNQKHCTKVEESMAEARRLIENRNQKRLYSLYMENMKLQFATEIVERVIEMSRVPDLLKQYLKKKQYLHGVLLLSRAIDALFEDDLKDIGALKDIHDNILETRNHLSEDLLDQLDAQIYLKSSGPRSRLQNAESFQSTVQPVDDVSLVVSQYGATANTSSNQLSIDPGVSTSDIDSTLRPLLAQEALPEFIRNPEQDSTRYMTLLTHALHRLQRLPAARTGLLKRLRPALRAIIESETNAIKQEAFSSPRSQASRRGSTWAHNTLIELLKQVFSAFTRVLFNHNLVCRLLNSLESVPFSEDAYGIVRCWFEMQSETWAMLLSYLQQSSHPSVPTLRTVSHSNTLEISSPSAMGSSNQMKLNFSFADSCVASVSGISQNGEKRPSVVGSPVAVQEPNTTSNLNWIPVLPDNILIIYQPVMDFTDQAKNLTGVQRKHQGDMLRDMLASFVKVSFVPRVRADANFRVNEIFANSFAFALHESGSRSEHDNDRLTPGLAVSVFEVSGVIEHIMDDYFRLPYDKMALQECIIGILTRVLGRYQEKFQEVTSGIYSVCLVGDPAVIEILRQDPIYQQNHAFKTITKLTQAEFFKQEIPVYYRLLNQLDRLDQGQLLLDPKQWQLIAVISESLTWLLQRVVTLTNPSSSGQLFEIPPNIQHGFQLLAEKCTMLLRIEFHCHSFYFLGNMVSCDYASRDETSEAEKFVVDLNKDLCSADEALSTVLSQPREILDHIFGTQVLVVTLILIRNAAAMQNKLINRQGQARILRNIFALQQNLALVAPNSNPSLDRARQYWELLKETDVDVFLQSHQMLYSQEEIIAIKNLHRVFAEARARSKPIVTLP